MESSFVNGRRKRPVAQPEDDAQESWPSVSIIAVAGIHRLPIALSVGADIKPLKQSIAQRLSLQPTDVRLMHMGKELSSHSGETLQAAGLTTGTVLHAFPSGGHQIPAILPVSSSSASLASSSAAADARAVVAGVRGPGKRARGPQSVREEAAQAEAEEEEEVIVLDDDAAGVDRPGKRPRGKGREPASGAAPHCAYAGPPYFNESSYYGPAATSSSSSAGGSGRGVVKRPHRFRAQPSADISARIARATSQRMVFLDRTPLVAGDPSAGSVFRILGTTGNLYSVRFDTAPRCTCPDGHRHANCKHVLYIKLRVLRVPAGNPLLWQDGYMPWEVAYMLSHGHGGGDGHTTAGPGAVPAAPASVAGSTTKRRAPAAEDDCPIRFDTLGTSLSTLTWCATCGNNVHKECFGAWAKQKRGARETVTCVHCRAPWQDPEALAGLTAAVASSAASGGVPSSYSAALAAALGAGQSSAAAVTVNREGYLNFGQVPGLGLSPSRDTSTYYSGPRRGQANRSWGGDS